MESATRSWLQYWIQDLEPAPGRLNKSLQITLTSIVVLVTMMVLQMPYVAYGLYVIFMVDNDSPAGTLRTGIGVVCSVFCALSSSLIVVILTDNNPLARVISVAAITFVAGMITVATSLPSLGSGGGLFFCIGIGFWENHSKANTIVENSLWLLAAFSTGMVVTVGLKYVFATRSPANQLTDKLRARYRALETMFMAYANPSAEQHRRTVAEHVSRLAAEGNAGLLRLYSQVVDNGLDKSNLPVGAYAHITVLAELLDSSAAFGLQTAAEDAETRSRCEVVARQCGQLARGFRIDSSLEHNLGSWAGRTHLDRVEAMIRSVETMSSAADNAPHNLVVLPPRQVPLLVPGAIRDRRNVAFALKISLCATACYILYHAIDWPGISTCVVTVMTAGLSHTGAMKQKLALRLLGATIGGLFLGIGAEVFLFPFMDSITALVVVVGVIAFLGGWVMGGSRFNYVGSQMAFAFYITSLEGFSAPTELAPARDRFVGIVIAIIVMWFVFDQVWPVRTVTATRRAVASVLKDAARAIAIVDAKMPFRDYMRESDILRDRVGKQLSAVRMLNEATQYEFGISHVQDMQTSDTLLRMSITVVALIWNHAAILHKEPQRGLLMQPALTRLRHAVSQRLSVIADALEQRGRLSAEDTGGLIEAVPSVDERDSEYSRNTIARYNEVHALALSLPGAAHE